MTDSTSSHPPFIHFASRRSVVHSTTGLVACTQPLAAAAGQRILRQGGNAADAAVATAAALALTEPVSNGLGGDLFCLYYDATTRKVSGWNASGRSPQSLSLEKLQSELGLKPGETGTIPLINPLAATVPGAPAGWVDIIEKLGSGKVSLAECLQPAIELAENGFAVSDLTAQLWRDHEEDLRKASSHFAELLRRDPKAPDGHRAPREGEIFANPGVARGLKLLAEHGKKGFYEGPVADAIVQVMQETGGFISHADLLDHMQRGTEKTEPLHLDFAGQDVSSTFQKQSSGLDESSGAADDPSERQPSRGVRIWEHAPNGQGMIALIALGILEELERSGRIPVFSRDQHNSPEYLHAVIESLRIAFADGRWWIADPEKSDLPLEGLLSRDYLTSRAKLFDPNRIASDLQPGSPAMRSSDTVYFAVTDAAGNAASFIQSHYSDFGTAIVVPGFGFTLQARAAGFSLQPPNHPNIYAPGKRPYHTIIPALVTNPQDESLHSILGVMGAFMQPQGHVQVLLNMLAFGMSEQVALDAPRFCIGAGTPSMGSVTSETIFLEDGIPEETAAALRRYGHHVRHVRGHARSQFGRGQIIRQRLDGSQRVFSAGSDPRGDGAAFPA